MRKVHTFFLAKTVFVIFLFFLFFLFFEYINTNHSHLVIEDKILKYDPIIMVCFIKLNVELGF